MRHIPMEGVIGQGDKSTYTDQQRRQVKSIEEGYALCDVAEEEAKRRAWSTKNKTSGGGYKSTPAGKSTGR